MECRSRRQFLQGSLAVVGFGLLPGCGFLTPEVRQAQNIPRVGFLTSAPQSRYAAFLDGLHDLGYIEGQTIVIEYRDAEGNLDLVPDLTAELLELRVALIVAAPSSVA